MVSGRIAPARTLTIAVLGAVSLLAAACASNEAVRAPDVFREPKTYTVVHSEGIAHTVAPNEHLAGIAAEYEVAIEVLVELNDIAEPTVIEVGAEIIIRAAIVETIEIVPAKTVQLASPGAARSGVLNGY